jgi:hypothetical protein
MSSQYVDRVQQPDRRPADGSPAARSGQSDFDAELALVLPRWDLLPPVEFVQRHRKP